ncbi:hypothetical protein, partial [Micromonospora sp. KC721]|uniref:hypothetical protein n=1 Tax=Micromonospora sp. KC721 TaxID=2530380 RepID=UPI0014056063
PTSATPHWIRRIPRRWGLVVVALALAGATGWILSWSEADLDWAAAAREMAVARRRFHPAADVGSPT